MARSKQRIAQTVYRLSFYLLIRTSLLARACFQNARSPRVLGTCYFYNLFFFFFDINVCVCDTPATSACQLLIAPRLEAVRSKENPARARVRVDREIARPPRDRDCENTIVTTNSNVIRTLVRVTVARVTLQR